MYSGRGCVVEKVEEEVKSRMCSAGGRGGGGGCVVEEEV
jgi:hypothetical protein